MWHWNGAGFFGEIGQPKTTSDSAEIVRDYAVIGCRFNCSEAAAMFHGLITSC